MSTVAFFAVAFAQHDWLNDYFHFSLSWQRWQKDYIPVEGKGETNPRGQIAFIVNRITCFAGILSRKSCLCFRFGLGCDVPGSAAGPKDPFVLIIVWKGEKEKLNIPRYLYLLFASLGSCWNKLFFLWKINQFFSNWHLLEHFFFCLF